MSLSKAKTGPLYHVYNPLWNISKFKNLNFSGGIITLMSCTVKINKY